MYFFIFSSLCSLRLCGESPFSFVQIRVSSCQFVIAFSPPKLDRRFANPEHIRMFKLSAFADEISPDLDEQIKGCRENDITHFELRSVNKINVLDLNANLRKTIKSKLA